VTTSDPGNLNSTTSLNQQGGDIIDLPDVTTSDQPGNLNSTTSLNQQGGDIVNLPGVTTSDQPGNLNSTTNTKDAPLRKDNDVAATQADVDKVYDAPVANATSTGTASFSGSRDSELIIRRFQLPPKEHAKSSLSYGQAEASATLLALATVIGAGLWCMREERRLLEDCEDAEAMLDRELLPVSPPAQLSSRRDLALSRRVVAASSAV